MMKLSSVPHAEASTEELRRWGDNTVSGHYICMILRQQFHLFLCEQCFINCICTVLNDRFVGTVDWNMCGTRRFPVVRYFSSISLD